MSASSIEAAITALREEVSIEIANTPTVLREAYELRHQVYCVERGFEPGRDGIERDEYDDFARHAVVRWRQTGEVVGTVRLIIPRIPATGGEFPIHRVCDPALFQGLPLNTMGEVSRFALAKQGTKQVRSVSPASFSLLRFALIQGAVRLSAEAGHTHWLAVMEPTLIRLLRATGLDFTPLGPIVEYHGARQPSVAELLPMFSRMARERPIIWDFLTQGGTWYKASRSRSPRYPRMSAKQMPIRSKPVMENVSPQ